MSYFDIILGSVVPLCLCGQVYGSNNLASKSQDNFAKKRYKYETNMKLL